MNNQGNMNQQYGMGNQGNMNQQYGMNGQYGMNQQQMNRQPVKANKSNPNNNRISAFQELKILLRQYRIMLISDKKNLAVMLMFPLAAALITVWIAGKDMYINFNGTKSASFVLVSAAIWGGLFNSIQTVVRERDNIKRDYVTGLRLSCYTLSRAIWQFVICMIQTLILCTSFIGVQMVHGNDLPKSGIVFGQPLIEYYISLLLLMYAADAMGLMISCIVRKSETANVMAPYILIIQLIFSGILFEMKGAAEVISYGMLSRWGMEGLGSISRLNDMKLAIEMEPNMPPFPPREAEAMFNANGTHLLVIWLCLAGFILGFLLVGGILLRRVSKDTR